MGVWLPYLVRGAVSPHRRPRKEKTVHFFREMDLSISPKRSGLSWKQYTMQHERICNGSYRQHPNWTRPQLAQATGMSVSWVDKWKKRLLNAPQDDEQVLRGLWRAPHHPLPRLDQHVVDRVLEIRDDPPEGLGRIPGPKAILY